MQLTYMHSDNQTVEHHHGIYVYICKDTYISACRYEREHTYTCVCVQCKYTHLFVQTDHLGLLLSTILVKTTSGTHPRCPYKKLGGQYLSMRRPSIVIFRRLISQCGSPTRSGSVYPTCEVSRFNTETYGECLDQASDVFGKWTLGDMCVHTYIALQ